VQKASAAPSTKSDSKVQKCTTVKETVSKNKSHSAKSDSPSKKLQVKEEPTDPKNMNIDTMTPAELLRHFEGQQNSAAVAVKESKKEISEKTLKTKNSKKRTCASKVKKLEEDSDSDVEFIDVDDEDTAQEEKKKSKGNKKTKQKRPTESDDDIEFLKEDDDESDFSEEERKKQQKKRRSSAKPKVPSKQKSKTATANEQ